MNTPTLTPAQHYYKNELSKVDTTNEYAPTIKITGTKHLSLNEESAAVLVEWLTANYLNK